MTQTSGLRHRHAPLNPRHSLNTLLRRQHHQSLRPLLGCLLRPPLGLRNRNGWTELWHILCAGWLQHEQLDSSYRDEPFCREKNWQATTRFLGPRKGQFDGPTVGELLVPGSRPG